jgi:hypothetical protein
MANNKLKRRKSFRNAKKKDELKDVAVKTETKHEKIIKNHEQEINDTVKEEKVVEIEQTKYKYVFYLIFIPFSIYYIKILILNLVNASSYFY